jgi:hypothetical protein
MVYKQGDEIQAILIGVEGLAAFIEPRYKSQIFAVVDPRHKSNLLQ